MKLKKGQAGGIEVSILVILIALFIIIYVILLPPEERTELLGDNTTDSSGASVPSGSTVLLSESPGKVVSYSKNIQTSKLEPLHLYAKDEQETQALVKTLTVSRNILKDNYKNIVFNIDDLDKIKDVKLFMMVQDSKGRLTIKLNGQIVYNGVLGAEQLPIVLPKDYLKTGNKLEFSVNLPGIFSSNYYVLQDVSIIKTYSTTKTESERFFFIDLAEGQQVKNSKLHYIVNCNELEPRGMLTILLNGHLASKDTVFCEYSDEIVLPLNKDHMSDDGRNKLEFSIDKGDYSFDQLRAVSELANSIYPKYVFDISSDIYSEAKAGKKKIMLKMTFADNDRKEMTVYMQEKQFGINTNMKDYTKDVTSMIDDGANYIKLIPKKDFEITSLKIYGQAA